MIITKKNKIEKEEYKSYNLDLNNDFLKDRLMTYLKFSNININYVIRNYIKHSNPFSNRIFDNLWNQLRKYNPLYPNPIPDRYEFANYDHITELLQLKIIDSIVKNNTFIEIKISYSQDLVNYTRSQYDMNINNNNNNLFSIIPVAILIKILDYVCCNCSFSSIIYSQVCKLWQTIIRNKIKPSTSKNPRFTSKISQFTLKLHSENQ
jgi:hypothetical protein